MIMCLCAAAFSWLRGGFYVNPEEAAEYARGARGAADVDRVDEEARADTVVEVAIGEGG
jgi:hypothetical protein